MACDPVARHYAHCLLTTTLECVKLLWPVTQWLAIMHIVCLQQPWNVLNFCDPVALHYAHCLLTTTLECVKLLWPVTQWLAIMHIVCLQQPWNVLNFCGPVALHYAHCLLTCSTRYISQYRSICAWNPTLCLDFVFTRWAASVRVNYYLILCTFF